MSLPLDAAQRYLQHLAVERRLADRTVAMYGDALARLQRLRLCSPGRTEAGAAAPCAQLDGTAAPGAAQHRHRAGGLARAVPLVGPPREVAANPWTACAHHAPRSRCRRPVGRLTMRSPWPTTSPRAGTWCCAHATTASSSCCTAAACASVSGRACDVHVARKPKGGSTGPTALRTCWARAAAAQRAGGAGGAAAGRVARAAPDGLTHPEQPALLVSRRGTAPSPSQVRCDAAARREPRAAAADEQRRLAGLASRARSASQASQRRQRRAPDRHAAPLAALAEHMRGGVGQVDPARGVARRRATSSPTSSPTRRPQP